MVIDGCFIRALVRCCAALCCAVLCDLAGSLVIATDCCVWNGFTDVCVYAYLYNGAPSHSLATFLTVSSTSCLFPRPACPCQPCVVSSRIANLCTEQHSLVSQRPIVLHTACRLQQLPVSHLTLTHCKPVPMHFWQFD